METRVGQKIPNPTWTPTAGIRQRSLERGIKLPPVVPAGPNNPLGRYALRLAHGNGEYLIHGTSAPDSVGLRVSSGCIRMNAPDIKALFSSVRTGTPAESDQRTGGNIPWNLTGCVMLKYIDHYQQKNSKTFRQCHTHCQQALRNLKTIRL